MSCTKPKKEEPAIKLHVEGIEYDQILANFVLVGYQEVTVNGIKEGSNTWVFPFPDSISDKIDHYSFSYAPIDTADGKTLRGTMSDIAFFALHEGDTIRRVELTMDKNMMEYNAKYVSHSTFENRIGDHIDWITETDIFEIPYKANTEFAIQSEHPYFGWFYDGKENKEIEYDKGIELYLEIIKKYPDSRYLISRVNELISSFKSKKDIEQLYDTFSEKNKQSPFGQAIKLHISAFDFENSSLPKWDTEESEDIIIDKSRNALIVFSASWCGPCRAQIPLLKEIYADVKDKVDFVFVSMDDRKTVDAWREEMKKEEIPWRSVLAADQLKEIREKYHVTGYPYGLLYRASDGKAEVIEVRSDEGKERVYDLAK